MHPQPQTHHRPRRNRSPLLQRTASLQHIAMKLPGKLRWDPDRERFLDNDEANNRLARTQRYPYGTSYVKI